MKKIFSAVLLFLSFFSASAQQKVSYGSDSTLLVSGNQIATAQRYDDKGTPTSVNKVYASVIGDSLIVFEVGNAPTTDKNYIYRYAVAKKDIVKEEDGIELDSTIENGKHYFLVDINCTDDTVTNQLYSNDEIESRDNTNRIRIYFMPEDEAGAKAAIEKIKKLITL